MAQHVTTLNEIREGMEQTDAPLSSDLVYAERGTGSDRGRAFTVGEIVQHGVEEQLGDGGDIEFDTYDAGPGVTKIKGSIQDGKILGRMFALLVDLIGKVLCWYNAGFGTTDIGYDGLRFWGSDYNPASPTGTPVYKFGKDGVVQLSKIVSKPRSLNQEGNKATQTEYRSMTNCELHAGNGTTTSATPELYLTAVMPMGSDKFVLDSTRHGVGSIVMVENTGVSQAGENDYPVKCYDASDSTYATVLKEIPKYGIALFIRKEDVNNLPVWRAIV